MQLRRILLIILAIFIFMGVVGAAGTYTIAARDSFIPGDRLFPAQVWSEQTWSLAFNKDQEQRAAILLAILERRLDGLEAVQGTNREMLALSYVDAALDQALLAINALPVDARPGWEARLIVLTERAMALMNGLDVMQLNPVGTAVLTLLDKFESLLRMMLDSDGSTIDFATLAATETNLDAVPTPEANGTSIALLNDARNVPFLQGNVNHSFFPLQGGHANVSCETCHSSGNYEATDARCIACHAQDDNHDGVYGRDCTLCHDISAWQNVNYDHSFIGNNDCATCHNPPANHFEGACRDCHSDTNNFRNATFDHSRIGGQDCAACHNPPANHYAGACRDCHSDTGNFRNASFNHSG
ncbi:MAG: hypothetical protein KC413_19095, partial [Anaerolineales bacterium]|nr:hypothetical protein [Anaerolineales bacterium]